MENFAATILFLAIGWLLRRSGRFPAESGNVLNLFVIWVSLPALVLEKMPTLPMSGGVLAPVLLPWLMVAVGVVLVLGAARLFAWPRPVVGALLLLVPLGNTSFLGVPMVRAFFGETGVGYALLYDQLGSFLALSTYGTLILALYGDGAARPDIRGVVRKVVTFPPFIALAVGLAWRFLPLGQPSMVHNILASLAATLVPVVMIAVGWGLTVRLDRRTLQPLVVGLALKLVAAPLAGLALVRLLGLAGEPARVAVFEAGMPPMVSAGALALLAGLAPELTAGLVGFGILASFVTLPLLFQLL